MEERTSHSCQRPLWPSCGRLADWPVVAEFYVRPLRPMPEDPDRMEMTTGSLAFQPSRLYRLLRPIFVAGLVLSLILYFVPCNKSVGDVLKTWLAMGGTARHLSSFDLCRLLVDTGNVQWGGFYMALCGIELALVLLAVRRPHRWVFIAGSCEQLYLLITFILRPSSETLIQHWFFAFLAYASWAMCLTGFFVKPPRTGLASHPEVAPSHAHEKTTA